MIVKVGIIFTTLPVQLKCSDHASKQAQPKATAIDPVQRVLPA